MLRKLREWGSLPESDVSRMLKQFFLVTDDFRDMAEEGLLDMALWVTNTCCHALRLDGSSWSSKGAEKPIIPPG